VPEVSRSQLVVYGAVAVAILLVGARWIHSADAAPAPGSSSDYSSATTTHAAPPGGSMSVSTDGEDVVVDVTGEVRSPGVYRLPAGSRVDDAVQRAGGAGPRANLEQINLAARLTDGQQVVVPARVSAALSASSSGDAAADGPISLGTATVEDLDTIEGIGPVTAQKIVDFRDQHGGISSIDELDQIDGIGPATLDSLRSRLQP
jgi:competence protein ComEA